MSTQAAERQEAPGIGALLAALEPAGQDTQGTGKLFRGSARLIIQAPDIRNDYKKSAGSSDGARTYDTTAT
jgi:hypothetical protein